MLNLKLKNKILIFFSLSFLGCATTHNSNSSFFIIKRELGGVTEIVVTPDRVLPECVDAEEEPDEGMHIFWIHMLDEENTVTTSMLGIRPDKKNCNERVRRTKKILKNAKRIYVGSHGTLSDDPRVEDRRSPHVFPKHGTFFDNGRILQLGIITNDRGECYNPMARDDEPCMEYPFPIEKHEKRLKR